MITRHIAIAVDQGVHLEVPGLTFIPGDDPRGDLRCHSGGIARRSTPLWQAQFILGDALHDAPHGGHTDRAQFLE